MKTLKKMLIFVLVLALSLSVIPFSISAESLSDSTLQEVDSQVVEANGSEPEILYEIQEKRNETTKHFAMSDGTIKACLYPQAVHYKKDKEFVEIDNTLAEVQLNGKTYYQNKSNSFKAKLPEDSQEYVEFSDENGFVKFRLVGALNKSIKKLNKKSAFKNADKDKTIVKNNIDRAIYKSVKTDIDIEYDISGNMLKETIVLNKKTKQSFAFEIITSAKSAVKNNDSSISFFDENGKEIYVIASPYMADSAGEYSSDVETTLTQTATGYTLVYTPNYEWLSTKERVYPVKIDPTMFKAIVKETVADTYVGNMQTATYNDIRGGWDILNIGRRTQTVGSNQITMRGLINFSIPAEIGKTDTIVSAKLDLVHRPQESINGKIQYVSNTGTNITVHELTSGFSEGGTWWGNTPSYNPTVVDYATINTTNYFPGTTVSYDSYDLTNLVSKWHRGDSINYGILLKYENDDVAVTSDKQVFYFAKQSVYYGDISKYVEITYRNTVGLENYWNYQSQDFGESGMGYVNLYNGNLVYVHNNTSFNSVINGFTLSHIYNSNLATTNYSNLNQNYGNGWKLNFIQKLEPITVTGNSNVKYRYTDGDGTQHYFVQTTNGKIVDEDGLGLTYTDISEGNLTKKLTDKDNTALKFDSNYFLRQIVDANGNSININYSSASGAYYPTTITTSSGGLYTLNYNSSCQLINIVDNAARITEFTYSNNYLTSIKYPDGRVTTFGYSGNKLSFITAPDNSKLQYNYYPANERVNSVSVVGKNGTSGNSVSFLYSHNQTAVTDLSNKKVTYQFDSFGRVVCVYDNHQNIYNQSYTPSVTNGSGIFANNKLATSTNGAVYVNNIVVDSIFSNGNGHWWHYTSGNNTTRNVVTGHSLLSTNSILLSCGDLGYSSIHQGVTTQAGKTYTLSAYLKLVNVVGGYGAGLEIVTSNNRMVHSFKTGTTDISINNGFEKFTATISLEEGETIVRVGAGLFYAKGSVYVDSIQLEEGDCANTINLITNSSFEINAVEGNLPTYFVTPNAGSVGAVTTSVKYQNGGNYAMRFNGTSSAGRSLYQTLQLSGKAGDVFSLGGWGKADSVPIRNQICFELSLHLVYTDGTSNWFRSKFNPYVNDWQFADNTFPAEKDYSYVEVHFGYNYNCNYAYFDNIFLYRDTMQSYVYDANGNVVSTKDYASQNSNFEYDNSNISKILNPQGTGFEYFYDNKGNLLSSRNGEGIINSIIYDSNGNPVSTYSYSDNSSAALQAGKTYYIQQKTTGEYLTVQNASTTGLTKVVEAAFNGGAEQKWKVVQSPKGGFLLLPQNAPGMALDVYQPNISNEYSMIIYYQNGSDAQIFNFNPQKNYTYQIEQNSSQDGKVLSVNRAVTNDYVSALAPQGEMNSDQCWYFKEVIEGTPQPITDGTYQIRILHSGKYLDAYTVTQGSNVIQWEYNLSSAVQRFNVQRYNNTEYYTLSPVNNANLYVTVSGDLNANSYPYVRLGDSQITDNKLFKLQYSQTLQAWQMVCKADESKCISIEGSSLANLAKSVVKGNSVSLEQGFIFEKLSDAITSSMTYQDNGNYPHTVTDSRGNTTTYTYDTARGLNTAVEDAKGNTTSYSYNQLNDRLESVSAGGKTVSYLYETNGAIKKITSADGTEYNFTYDDFGRNTQIAVGNNTLSSTVYRDNISSVVSRFTYGNGVYKDYTYDNLDRLTNESINGVLSRTYTYDKRGNIANVNDILGGITTVFAYDLIGRITGISLSDGQSLSYIYDKYNRISNSKWSLGDISLNTGYIYGDNSVSGQKTGLIYGVKLNNTQKISYTYDALSRLSGKTINTSTPFITQYGYLEGATPGTTTTLVKTVKNGNNTLEYSYDQVGNITQVKKNGTVIESYTYDALNQLSSATYGGNTYNYTYDNGGNILYIEKNGEILQSYGYYDEVWKDRVTFINGQLITYDSIGNPLTYYRDELGFTWSNGRQLTAVTQGESALATYTYNSDGLRTSKTVNGTTTNYYWANGILQGQKTGSEYMLFLYDENGNKYGFLLKNGTTEQYYYYVFNLQGDVIGIVDSQGSTVVEYTYGVWGDLLITTGTLANTIGQTNPIRYRGYYYDSETGFYYVSSRYYDPEISRWINADTTDVLTATPMGLTDKNLFAYCDNNPVMRADYGGDFWHIVVGAAVGALIGGVVKAVSNAIEGKSLTDGLTTAVLAGAASGALASTGVGIFGMVAGNAAISMAENSANQVIENKGFNNFDVGDMLIDGTIGGVSGALGGAGKGTKHLTNLGKQTVKRTFNATTNKGIRAGLKEAGKAFAYYGKNSAKYYKTFVKGLASDFISTVGTTIASSNYMKYQYRRIFGR